MRQANRHLLQRRSDAMGVAVIDFSVPVTTPFSTAGSPSRSGSPGYGGLRHCFYDDFPITNRLPGGGANHIVVALIVGFTDAHVGQHVLGIGDRHRVGGNVAADNLANRRRESLLTCRNSGRVLLAISSASFACRAALASFSPSTLCTSSTIKPMQTLPRIIGIPIFETISTPRLRKAPRPPPGSWSEFHTSSPPECRFSTVVRGPLYD